MNCCGFRQSSSGFGSSGRGGILLIGLGSFPIAIAIPSNMVLDDLSRSVTSYPAFLYDRELILNTSDGRAQVGT